MASTRDIRRRIKSVKNTAQITKAMQMVAASKMRKAQDHATQGHPYTQQFNHLLNFLQEGAKGNLEHPFLKEGKGKGRPCYLLVTTDKGLCGALNTNLLREVGQTEKDALFVTVGRKGLQFLGRSGREVLADFELEDGFTFIQSKQISQLLIDQFLSGDVSSVSVLYSHFVNTLVQKPSQTKLLPLDEIVYLGDAPGEHDKVEEEKPSEIIFEPSAEEVLSGMLPYYIHFLVYQMILNARASEHSARMVAMKSATDNAQQLIKDLTLEYNKARQAAITNELLEISSAQMALG